MSKGTRLWVLLAPVYSWVPGPVHPLPPWSMAGGGGGAAASEPFLSLARTQVAGGWECGGQHCQVEQLPGVSHREEASGQPVAHGGCLVLNLPYPSLRTFSVSTHGWWYECEPLDPRLSVLSRSRNLLGTSLPCLLSD